MERAPKLLLEFIFVSMMETVKKYLEVYRSAKTAIISKSSQFVGEGEKKKFCAFLDKPMNVKT